LYNDYISNKDLLQECDKEENVSASKILTFPPESPCIKQLFKKVVQKRCHRHTHTHTHTYIYIYFKTWRERKPGDFCSDSSKNDTVMNRFAAFQLLCGVWWHIASGLAGRNPSVVFQYERDSFGVNIFAAVPEVEAFESRSSAWTAANGIAYFCVLLWWLKSELQRDILHVIYQKKKRH